LNSLTTTVPKTLSVFEGLRARRPRGGKRRSTLKQRFHGWLHRALVKRVESIAQERGLRVAFANGKRY